MAKSDNRKVGYVSELDQFIEGFDEKPEAQSPNRRAEEDKYQRVHNLRDNPQEDKEDSSIWSGF